MATKVCIQLENDGAIVHEGLLEFNPYPNDQIRYTTVDDVETLYKIERVTSRLHEFWVPVFTGQAPVLNMRDVVVHVEVSVVP